MAHDLPVLLDLFLTFMKIGLFTFGGGYAMISVITDACVDKKRWITHDEMMNVTVIAESTPGPIAINCATYVGQKIAGLTGAIAATLGIVLPSFAIIYLISMFMENLLDVPVIASALAGVRIGVSLLILRVGVTMLRNMPKKRLPRVIALCAFIAMLLLSFLSIRISSIVLMFIAGAVSLLLFVLKGAPSGKERRAK